MPKFRHVPNVVEAHRERYAGQRETPSGTARWADGWWTIPGENGVLYNMPHEVFMLLYVPDDDEARAYLDEVAPEGRA